MIVYNKRSTKHLMYVKRKQKGDKNERILQSYAEEF